MGRMDWRFERRREPCVEHLQGVYIGSKTASISVRWYGEEAISSEQPQVPKCKSPERRNRTNNDYQSLLPCLRFPVGQIQKSGNQNFFDGYL